MVASRKPDQIRQLLGVTAEGVSLRVKVVPGASRTAIRGVLGDRLKVTVAAPAEGGQANQAVCALLAKAFGVARRAVAVTAGRRQSQKTIVLQGLDQDQAAAGLERLLAK